VILNFFEKKEKNNADMDVTCKLNTNLEKAFFCSFEPFCADLASKFAKSGFKCPKNLFLKIKKDTKKRRFQNC
jgi:hypothetical protein